MGRASFGGSSDYSALFASIYGAQDVAAKQAEYDAKQAAAEAKAKQAAQDQDMADQWANGLISNEKWLAYIATRVQQTAGDPAEHEKWVKYQRKYQEQIADSTAEFNFANGGSINDLIAYYQVKIAGKTAGSKDTQKDQLRLNELIDQRASETVAKGAQAIVDRINAGTGTYEELLKFEKSALADVRPGIDRHDLSLGDAVFLHQHRIRTRRHRRTGEDARSGAWLERFADRPGGDALRHRQRHARRGHVGDAHGVAVHRTVVEWRHGDRGGLRRGEHAAEGLRDGNGFDVGHAAGAFEQGVKQLVG